MKSGKLNPFKTEMFYHQKVGLVILLFVGLVGCASSHPSASMDSGKLVGLWRRTSDYTNQVILRKSDGTYMDKNMQVYDLSKPAALITSHGNWQLNGRDYVLTVTEASNVAGAVAGDENGKPFRYKIETIAPDEFDYWTIGDNVIVTERKIGNASEAAFNKAVVLSPSMNPKQ